MRISDWSSDVCSSDLRKMGYGGPNAGARRSAGTRGVHLVLASRSIKRVETNSNFQDRKVRGKHGRIQTRTELCRRSEPGAEAITEPYRTGHDGATSPPCGHARVHHGE